MTKPGFFANDLSRQSWRRERAEARQEARDARSPQEQLQLLERRGHGHCQEAESLRQEISDGTD